MIHITKGQNNTIYYTATENTTFNTDNFLFVFIHSATNEKVLLNLTKDNVSNRFDVSTIELQDSPFEDSTEGMWKYVIREKESSSDQTETGTIVEEGYMYLHAATAFTPSTYTEQSNEFIIYNEQ
jgi:hypothetical protein